MFYLHLDLNQKYNFSKKIELYFEILIFVLNDLILIQNEYKVIKLILYI